jgi:hypothetical protein
MFPGSNKSLAENKLLLFGIFFDMFLGPFFYYKAYLLFLGEGMVTANA